MKKIPTLFTRIFDDHHAVGILNEITPGCEKAFKEGYATIKWDGSCCAIFDGVLYKRYDAKNGKKPPEGAIPCCDPDPVTGHWPHWVKVDENNPADKWFIEAFIHTYRYQFDRCTYEAIGPHFQGNPYELTEDRLMLHGLHCVDVERTFDGVREYLTDNNIEGLVFWLDDEPICKIKRSDFGLPWNKKEKKCTPLN